MEYVLTKEELKYLENQRQASYLIKNLLARLKRENFELYCHFLSKHYKYLNND